MSKLLKKETLRCINVASDMYRDTLRDINGSDGDSDAGDDEAIIHDPKNLVLFHEDGSPNVSHIHLPWKLRDSLHNVKPVYVHTINGRESFTHPMTRNSRSSRRTGHRQKWSPEQK